MISEKFDYVNLHKYIATHHLSVTCRNKYKDVTFPLPLPAEIDSNIVEASQLVAFVENIQVPCVIPPARGRPEKNDSKRKRSWVMV